MRYLYTAGVLIGAASAQGYIPLATDLQCPAGFELIGKKCEQASFTTASLSCVLGALQGDRCVTTTSPIRQCPIGSVDEGGACKVISAGALQKSCPGGYSQEGSACVQKTPLPLVDVCEIGRADGSGMCVLTEQVSKVIKQTCPPGYTNEGSTCMRLSTYDCSPPAGPLKIPQLPVSAGKGASIPLYAGFRGKKRMLGAGGKKSYAPLSIAPIAAAPAAAPLQVVAPAMAPVPASSVNVMKQLCQRQDFAPLVAEQFCPAGYADVGNSCVTTATYPMSKRCSNGGSAGACYDLKTAPLITSCAGGTVVGDRCVLTQVIPQETVCPAGTENSGGACLQFTTATGSCPPGHHLDGGNCVGKLVTEPIGTITQRCSGKGCFDHPK